MNRERARGAADQPFTVHEPRDFSLVVGGPLYRLYLLAHLSEPSMGLAHRRVLALIVLTWVPLLLFAAVDVDTPATVKVSFLRDLEAHVRLLLALPLLIVGEPIVHERVTMTVRQFVDRRLVAPQQLWRFIAAVKSSVRLTDSVMLELCVLVIAVGGGHWLWAERLTLRIGTWYATPEADGTLHLTLAGRWYALVSLPIFRFLLLRWYVRLIVVWYRFLWTVSRIPLRLNALHPDRTGGLGFLDANAFAFIPLLVAQTTLLSAVIAERIWNEGARLPQFRLEILAVVLFLLLIALLPQTFFVVQLERAWRAGLNQYGVFGSRYVERFRHKWLAGRWTGHESPLGSADIQSLADLANAFEIAGGMSLIPMSKKTVLRLGLTIAAPLLPLVLTMIPLDDVVDRAINLFI